MSTSAQDVIAESPTSPGGLSGDTATEKDEETESTHGALSLISGNMDSIDLESQCSNEKRRPSLLQRVTNSLSLELPPHWKPGFINEHRDTKTLDEYPSGFPRFAAWMNCDPNFLVTRRYGWLHTRVMLYRQSELRELELKLQRSDKQDLEEEEDALIDHQSFGSGEAGDERKQLIRQIDDKLREYGEFSFRLC